jgi:hypothetical protein
VTTRDRDYQMMMTAPADVTRRRDRELAGADQAYQDNAARAAGELGRAEGEAADADRWAGAAAAQVLDVDREAARLWEQLRRARGLRLRALGELPDPVPVDTLPRIALPRTPTLDDVPPVAGPPSARMLLARAAGRIDDRTRPVARRPLPRWALPLLPVLGAFAAGLTGLLAAVLVTFGTDPMPGGLVVRVLGWLSFLAAPSSGVPVAAFLAHRRLLAKLDIGGIGLTLLGGMIAATLMSLAFAATQ